MTTELLDPKQVAGLLGVTEKRLADWRYRGEGPDYLKLGHRTIRYQRTAIDAWLEDHTVRTEDGHGDR